MVQGGATRQNKTGYLTALMLVALMLALGRSQSATVSKSGFVRETVLFPRIGLWERSHYS